MLFVAVHESGSGIVSRVTPVHTTVRNCTRDEVGQGDPLMTRIALLTLALLCALAYPGAAKDPGQEAYMIRMLACEGPDAKMEVYLPQSIEASDAARADSPGHRLLHARPDRGE